MPFARWVYAQVPRFSPGRAALKDRLLRAAESTVLNIAEGARQESPKMAKKHCRIALASAAECAAALELLAAFSGGSPAEGRVLLNRTGAMLRKLAR